MKLPEAKETCSSADCFAVVFVTMGTLMIGGVAVVAVVAVVDVAVVVVTIELIPNSNRWSCNL